MIQIKSVSVVANGQLAILENPAPDVLNLLSLLMGPQSMTMAPPIVSAPAVEDVKHTKDIAPPVPHRPEEECRKPVKAKRQPRRRKAKNEVEVSLLDCVGTGLYPTLRGIVRVAIWKIEDHKGVQRERLLWIDDDNETARHDDGGFLNSMGRLHTVVMF